MKLAVLLFALSEFDASPQLRETNNDWSNHLPLSRFTGSRTTGQNPRQARRRRHGRGLQSRGRQAQSRCGGIKFLPSSIMASEVVRAVLLIQQTRPIPMQSDSKFQVGFARGVAKALLAKGYRNILSQVIHKSWRLFFQPTY